MGDRLFSYKMTHDTGFAPNPFGGFLTIATCKPLMRKHKRVGDWIAGFTSARMDNAWHRVGEERIVFLMRVSDKVTLAEYWSDPRFVIKRQQQDAGAVGTCGDNIYRPTSKQPVLPIVYDQIKNIHHSPRDATRDVGGEFVLIADEFYYFGSKALVIPTSLRPGVPRGQAAHGKLTRSAHRAQEFIEWMRATYAVGIHSHPHKWPRNEESWRRFASNPESEGLR